MAVLGVQHDRDRAVGSQATGERFHACQCICQVMEHAGRHHEIEIVSKAWDHRGHYRSKNYTDSRTQSDQMATTMGLCVVRPAISLRECGRAGPA
jgi:hypothetical protein